MTIKVTVDNFEAEVMNSSVPVLIDFWAGWCRPCQMLAPIVEDLGKEVQGVAKVAKINIDEEPELANAFKVMSIPTVVVMKDGKVVNATVGVHKKDALRKMLGV